MAIAMAADLAAEVNKRLADTIRESCRIVSEAVNLADEKYTQNVSVGHPFFRRAAKKFNAYIPFSVKITAVYEQSINKTRCCVKIEDADRGNSIVAIGYGETKRDPKDNFDRHVGRNIALARALKNVMASISIGVGIGKVGYAKRYLKAREYQIPEAIKMIDRSFGIKLDIEDSVLM